MLVRRHEPDGTAVGTDSEHTRPTHQRDVVKVHDVRVGGVERSRSSGSS